MTKRSKTLKFSTSSRQQSGVTVFSVSCISLLATILVASLQMVMSTGTTFYMQEKLSFVASQAANHASTFQRWNQAARADADNVERTTDALVDDLCTRMAMPLPARVDVSPAAKGMSVRLVWDSVRLPKSAGSAIGPINLTQAATMDFIQPPAWVNMFVDNAYPRIVGVPCYGIYRLNVSSGAYNHAFGVHSYICSLRHFDLPYSGYTMAFQCPTAFQRGSGPPTVMEPIQYLAP